MVDNRTLEHTLFTGSERERERERKGEGAKESIFIRNDGCLGTF